MNTFFSQFCAGLMIVCLMTGCDQPKKEAASVTAQKTVTSNSVFGKKILSELTAKVSQISDGDTIEVVTDDDEKLTVRMESVDAPEGNAPFSDLAKKTVTDLIMDKQVQLLTTGKDGRGRTLAFVIHNGTNISSYLIEQGIAKHYKRYSKDAELAALEQAAKDKKLNIWADPDEPAADAKPLTAPLSILTWNVESGGSDINVIAEQLKELAGHTIYGLSEVDGEAFEIYRDALGASFKSIEGTHKDNDHLQVIYDDSKVELLGWNEIDDVGDIRMNRADRAFRSPLLTRFRQRDNGAEFHVIMNHLARGDAEFRAQQAAGLREWARPRSMPIISIGDFNFDYVFETEQGNDGFDEFLRDNVWKWIQPEEMIDTNWYDPESDGVDNFPGSLLDFMFVAGAAKDLKWHCKVLVRDGDFPDDASTSDHRPVVLSLVSE